MKTLSDLLAEGRALLDHDARERQANQELVRRREREEALANWQALVAVIRDHLGALVRDLCDTLPEGFSGRSSIYHVALYPFGHAPLVATFGRDAGPLQDDHPWRPWRSDANYAGWLRVGLQPECVRTSPDVHAVGWKYGQPVSDLARAVALCHQAEQEYPAVAAECERLNAEAARQRQEVPF